MSLLTFLPGFVFQRQRSKNLALNATSTSHMNNRISLFLLFLSDTRSAPTRRPLAVEPTKEQRRRERERKKTGGKENTMTNE